MKIAFVISTFPPRIGGMGQIALSEARALVRLGYDVTVFTLDYGIKLSDDFLKVEYLKPLIRLGDAGLVPQLFFKLRGFDLVHLHFPFYGGSFGVFLAGWFFHLPYVVTYHMDAQPVGFVKRMIKFFGDCLFGGLIFRKAKKVILVDQNTEQFSLLKKIDSKKIIKINNTVDINIFSKKIFSYSELNLPDLSNKKILLFVGNLLPLKRLDLILQALRELSDPDLILLVVGGGYAQVDYRSMVSGLSLEKNVYFVAEIKNPEVLARFYSLSQATVIASDYESSSLVALESLACGTPVIASNISALRNKINSGVNGLLFERGNSEDLASKIKDFFNLPTEKREQMGAASREKIVKNFNPEKHLEDLVKVYQSIV